MKNTKKIVKIQHTICQQQDVCGSNVLAAASFSQWKCVKHRKWSWPVQGCSKVWVLEASTREYLISLPNTSSIDPLNKQFGQRVRVAIPSI